MTDPYLKVSIQNGDWSQRVLGVTLVVHTEGRWEHSPLSNNHVTQFLSISGDDRSIQINMRHLADDDINGRLEMTSRDYSATATRSLIVKISLPAGHFSVKDVHDLIVGGQDAQASRGLKDFCFADGGMGCRYWHITLIFLYEARQFVPSGSALSVFDFLSYLYTRTANVQPRTTRIIPGTFEHPRIQHAANQLWSQLLTAATAQATALHGASDLLSYVVQNLPQIRQNWNTTPVHVQAEVHRLRGGVDLENQDVLQQLRSQALATSTAALRRQTSIAEVINRSAALVARRAEEEDE